MTPEDIQKIITSEYLNQFGALNAHDYKKIPPGEWTLKAAKKIHEEIELDKILWLKEQLDKIVSLSQPSVAFSRDAERTSERDSVKVLDSLADAGELKTGEASKVYNTKGKASPKDAPLRRFQGTALSVPCGVGDCQSCNVLTCQHDCHYNQRGHTMKDAPQKGKCTVCPSKENLLWECHINCGCYCHKEEKK